jgi:hypothetical protein
VDVKVTEERQEVTFTRSQIGIRNKFDQSMKIMEYSILLVEFFNKKEFNNVIALQLRMLLCDNYQQSDISLLRKVQSKPKLFPIVNTFVSLDNAGGGFIAGELFDYSERTIPLTQWLRQVIYKINLGGKLHSITIKDFIKFSSNKSGGAHVDHVLIEKAFIVDVHSETVLCRIAKGVIKSLGRDLNVTNENNIKELLETLESARSN